MPQVKLNNTAYAILGLLTLGPKTGYDIKQEAETTISHFWAENYGHIYPILRRLHEAGLVEKETILQTNAPTKYVYSITPTGRAALNEWLWEEAVIHPTRNELLLKLFFGQSIPWDIRRQHVESYRRQHITMLNSYRNVEAELMNDHTDVAQFQYITLRAGIVYCEAVIGWCDEALQNTLLSTAASDYSFIDVKDYIALDENASSTRYEYLDGHLRLLAESSPAHSIIATNIASIFHSALRKTPCAVYNSDIRFKLSESRYVHPDITVGCDERDKGKKDNIRYPHLIVEVLSPTTEAIDKGEKLDMYLDYPTIEEYILVSSQKKMVEVYGRDGDIWVSRRYKPESIIHLSSIDVSIPFEDIYEKTSLL